MTILRSLAFLLAFTSAPVNGLQGHLPSGDVPDMIDGHVVPLAQYHSERVGGRKHFAFLDKALVKVVNALTAVNQTIDSASVEVSSLLRKMDSHTESSLKAVNDFYLSGIPGFNNIKDVLDQVNDSYTAVSREVRSSMNWAVAGTSDAVDEFLGDVKGLTENLTGTLGLIEAALDGDADLIDISMSQPMAKLTGAPPSDLLGRRAAQAGVSKMEPSSLDRGVWKKRQPTSASACSKTKLYLASGDESLGALKKKIWSIKEQCTARVDQILGLYEECVQKVKKIITADSVDILKGYRLTQAITWLLDDMSEFPAKFEASASEAKTSVKTMLDKAAASIDDGKAALHDLSTKIAQSCESYNESNRTDAVKV